jgi:hypothetical protein
MSNVPQDVMENTHKPDLIEKLSGLARSIEVCEGWRPTCIDEAIAKLRDQRQQGAEPVASPDGEDYLRLSKSGYTLRVGWGDSMRFVAASPKPLHELSSEQQKQWLDDAERLCDGWNRATPPQANALVAAAYRKAAEIVLKQASELEKYPELRNVYLELKEQAKNILAAIPADAEAALREVCMKVATAVRMQALSGPIECNEIEAIVNSVLEGKS